MIARFEDALLIVIHQPKHARVFDRRLRQWDKFRQRHT
jgi:hypothetical protein